MADYVELYEISQRLLDAAREADRNSVIRINNGEFETVYRNLFGDGGQKEDSIGYFFDQFRNNCLYSVWDPTFFDREEVLGEAETALTKISKSLERPAA